jgi:UDP-N-acetylglucosamine 4-epimerase
LNELFLEIRQQVALVHPAAAEMKPSHQPERVGDVRHSLADISLVQAQLGYAPTHNVDQGLVQAAAWYLRPSA